tara:strand:+ start:669 stop:1349 length:681 start_codon:yes stop_codon:yes gene_type:complete
VVVQLWQRRQSGRQFRTGHAHQFCRHRLPAKQHVAHRQAPRRQRLEALEWRYDSLLTGVDVGMAMPAKLNPGPWASQVSFAAPVSLFLFFFLLFVFTTIKDIKIHPMNYFFVDAASFSFHLLLAYLVDHISIHLAFFICSAVSIFLVVSYMRLVVGLRLALVGLTQFIYLVLFSYTLFFEGYTGLAITLLCIATLFAAMQFTGRVDWEAIFNQSRGEQHLAHKTQG